MARNREASTPHSWVGGTRERTAAARRGRLVLSTRVLQEFFVSVTRKLERPLPASEGEAAAKELTTLEVVEDPFA